MGKFYRADQYTTKAPLPEEASAKKPPAKAASSFIASVSITGWIAASAGMIMSGKMSPA
jgi:hypothetical protein